MANIAINNYCNLKCPYCFADDMIQEKSQIMTLDNYKKVIKYLTQNQIQSFGIIGGEPTLHPLFKQILIETNQCCNATGVIVTLFTNGINLQQFIPYIGQNIFLLINCNNPDNMTQNQFLQFQLTLQHLQELGWLQNGKAHCGCNLYIDCEEYNWIWTLVEKYNIQSLRVSVTSPGGIYTKWKKNKHEYFQLMKPIFLKFCEQAKKHKIILNLDCGHIPACYFNKDEIALIEEVTNERYTYFNCNPVMDITPDLRVTPCFGSYNPIPIDFDDNWKGLDRYLLYNYNIPKALNNTQGKCANCNKIQKLQCQGGCLGFSSLS